MGLATLGIFLPAVPIIVPILAFLLSSIAGVLGSITLYQSVGIGKKPQSSHVASETKGDVQLNQKNNDLPSKKETDVLQPALYQKVVGQNDCAKLELPDAEISRQIGQALKNRQSDSLHIEVFTPLEQKIFDELISHSNVGSAEIVRGIFWDECCLRTTSILNYFRNLTGYNMSHSFIIDIGEEAKAQQIENQGGINFNQPKLKLKIVLSNDYEIQKKINELVQHPDLPDTETEMTVEVLINEALRDYKKGPLKISSFPGESRLFEAIYSNRKFINISEQGLSSINQRINQLKAKILEIMPNAELNYDERQLTFSLKAEQAEEFKRLWPRTAYSDQPITATPY